MSDTDARQSTETWTVTGSSIEEVEDVIDAVESIVGGSTEKQYHADLTLSELQSQRVRNVIDALVGSTSTDGGSGVDVSAPGDSVPPTTEKTGRPGGGSGEGKRAYPDPGEIEDPPEEFTGPQYTSIRYAVLALLSYLTDSEGYTGTWVTVDDIHEDDYCPYSRPQVASAVSDLFSTYGAVSRRGVEESTKLRGPYVEFRPTDRSRKYVMENGKFPWPVDENLPSPIGSLDKRPFVAPAEPGHPEDV